LNAEPNFRRRWHEHDRPALRIAGLFAGIGGFELGLARSGHDAAVFCEFDSAAQAVLRHRFPDVEVAPDVRNLRDLPEDVSIITAGFPCQDLSSSGLKKGLEGTRSSLVAEVFRILEAKRVEWVLIENVHFMLHLNKGAGIREIADNLERLGYNWAYRVLDTNAFGLPQRRRRVFVLASMTHDPRDVILSDDAPLDEPPVPRIDRPIGFYWTEGTYATGLADDAIPPLKGGSTIGIPSPPAILMPDGRIGTPDIRDAERLQGFDADWTIACNEAHRPSLRWRLVGNAVSVNAAEWIGKKLRMPQPYSALDDLPVIEGKTWPNAAWSINGRRHVSQASTRPIRLQAPSLQAFLQHDLKPLSEKATSGFLKRARKGNLRFPVGFLETLQARLERVDA
jgi:DNA (cytosine-5)-methyltransferase 1